MSAYLMSDYEFSVLGEALQDERKNDPRKAKDFAKILFAENIKSLEYRYPNSGPEYESNRFYFDKQALSGLLVLGALELIKGIHCYRYQSCEHKEWDESEAKKLVDRLESFYIGKLPGYGELTWGLRRPECLGNVIRLSNM